MQNSASGPGGLGEAERLRLLVDTIRDYALIYVDAQGSVQVWSRAAQLLTGLSEAEAIGLHLDKLLSSDLDTLGLGGGILVAARERGRFDTNIHVGPDAARRLVRLSVEVISAGAAEGQSHNGFAVTMRALDDDGKIASGLESTEASFKRLVHNISDYAIYTLTLDGRVASWNRGAELITGYSASEILGVHVSEFSAPEDRAAGKPSEALAAAREFGHFHEDVWRVRKDGSQFWASTAVDAIRDEDGTLVGYAKITRDITDRMNQQKSLEQAREELFQTQKLEAIGQLTGGVAHDFNNLLMVVMGSLEVLKRRSVIDDRNTRLIDNAYQAAQRGAQLTKRMLAFARKQDLQNQAVDLSELVRGMSEMLSRTLGHAVTIETEFPISLPRVNSDPNQLDAALLNLAVNARDAMPRGGRLRFSATEKTVADLSGKLKPGRYVRLRVEDTGEGMDAETLTRAADPFFTTKGVGKGTGLGLSMVQGIAEQSGGMMQIRSEPGEGTVVELWFEAIDEIACPESPPHEEVALQSLAAKDSLKVLAVDDDALVLLNTSLMLEELGHQVVEAHSGAEALTLLQAHDDIDVVITDHAMPRMTGVALAEEIAKRFPGMPVALASGYADIEQARRMNLPRLAKPFTQGELQRLISTMTEASAA